MCSWVTSIPNVCISWTWVWGYWQWRFIPITVPGSTWAQPYVTEYRDQGSIQWLCWLKLSMIPLYQSFLSVVGMTILYFGENYEKGAGCIQVALPCSFIQDRAAWAADWNSTFTGYPKLCRQTQTCLNTGKTHIHFCNDNCQNGHLARGSSPTEGSGEEGIAHAVCILQQLSGSEHPVKFTSAVSKSCWDFHVVLLWGSSSYE